MNINLILLISMLLVEEEDVASAWRVSVKSMVVSAASDVFDWSCLDPTAPAAVDHESAPARIASGHPNKLTAHHKDGHFERCNHFTARSYRRRLATVR